MTHRWTGLIAAPHAPFHADASLNPDAVALQVAHLVESGVAGAFVNGTTGEWASLSLGERRALADAWIAARPPGFRVIVHVGALAQSEAIALARHAAAIGADGVAALAPSFFKPGLDALLDWLEPLGDAASGLPFYYYHLPALTGVRVDVPQLAERAIQRIPHFAGVKFSEGDLFVFQELLRRFDDRLEFFWGVDEALLGALAIGARAAVGSHYNWLAPHFVALIAAHERGDRDVAIDLSRRIGGVLVTVLGYGSIPTQKAMLQRLGIPVGAPRPPLAPLAGRLADELFAALRRDGVLP